MFSPPQTTLSKKKLHQRRKPIFIKTFLFLSIQTEQRENPFEITGRTHNCFDSSKREEASFIWLLSYPLSGLDYIFFSSPSHFSWSIWTISCSFQLSKYISGGKSFFNQIRLLYLIKLNFSWNFPWKRNFSSTKKESILWFSSYFAITWGHTFYQFNDIDDKT